MPLAGANTDHFVLREEVFVVAFLVANKADIEAKERNGYTPLTQAGWRSHWDAAGLLLKAGAVCQQADLVGDWLYGECTKRK